MKKALLAFCFILLSGFLFGQRGKNGAMTVSSTVLVNEYTALTANAAAGATSVTVAGSGLNTNARFGGNLAAGDLVMIIQMQGASIKTGVIDSTYGTITAYNNCGLYELREVLSVPNGTTINLTCPLTNSYTAAGVAQVVRVPRYSSLTVNAAGGLINCDPWNGQIGGVIAIEVLGATTINGSIDASTFGFRGGVANNAGVPQAVSVFYTMNADSGAEKGESIAGFEASYNIFGGGNGRGAAANGGGGGNSHNAGGGGGGNGGNIAGYNSNGNPDVTTPAWVGAWNLEYPGFATNVSSGGGRGGYVWAKCGPNPLTTAPGDPAWGGDNRENHGGKGGRPLDYSTGRIFLGGGGGSGHEDNGVGSSGSAGGGIVFMMCYGTINGTGSVVSNGQLAPDANDGGVFTPEDGAGGAGAGGTIILNSVGAITGITATANGGKGGNQITGNNFQSECEGPGGGGSGGYIGLSSVGIVTSVSGGANGTTDASCMTAFIPNGATIGGPGTTGTITNFIIVAKNDTVCSGSVVLNASLVGTVPGGTTIDWYSASTGGVLLGTGPSYTTPFLTADSTFYVSTCPGDYRQPVSVIINGSLRDSISAFTNVSVACGSNGTATLGVKGAGPFTYLWSNGQTTSTATNLAAGSYTVTVKTTGGCSSKDSVTITQPPSLTVTVPTVVNVLCNGGKTGNAIANVTGGSTPYTYSWNNGETSAKDSLLGAGSYTISVTDANGCTVTSNTVITQPAPIRDSISTTINVLCNGGNTGSATVGVKGGTTAYNYTWTGAQTTQTATGLAAGNYTVTVKDANGCKDSAVANITQPTVLKLTAAAFAATCSGTCNGSANVIPAGGTSPYKYNWSNGTTNANTNNLCAGTFSVIVTDANGCTHDTNPLTVTQPPAITLTINSTSAYCNQADGSASISAAGGTTPYSYGWSNGATTTSVNNIKPGTYCVGVIDGNGCKDTVCVVVPNTSGEKASIASTINVTCNGGNNGSATGSAAGGTGPYTYSWSNLQTTQIATGLAAGTYTLTVTDATGCQDTAVATITQPAPVTITVTGGGQLCIGQNEILTATAVGGTGPYIYTWDATSVGSSYPVNPTVTTSYTVVAADANGCTSAPLVIPVKVRDSLHLTVIPVTTMCAGDTATLKALATGGDSTYTYTWTPGPITGSSIKVSPTSTTTYTVTVTDGCNTPSVQKTIVVNLFPSRPISFTADTLSGCQSVCVQFTDSVAGILKTISWNFGDGGTANITNPTHCFTNPGVYSISLTVTNDSGCVVSKSIPNMITVFSNPVAKFTWSPQPITSLDPTVTFIDQSTDNYGIVSWAWAFGDATDSLSTNKNTSHTYLDTGKFCPSLVVVNKHGCRDTVDHCLDVQPQFTIYIPNAFTPDANGLNDAFMPKGDYIKNFEMWIFDRWGQQIYHTTDIYTGWDGTVHGNKVQEDTYVYLIYATDPSNLQHSYLGRVSVVR